MRSRIGRSRPRPIAGVARSWSVLQLDRTEARFARRLGIIGVTYSRVQGSAPRLGLVARAASTAGVLPDKMSGDERRGEPPGLSRRGEPAGAPVLEGNNCSFCGPLRQVGPAWGGPPAI
jgi:hypothetical protein